VIRLEPHFAILRRLFNAFRRRKQPHPDGMLYDWRAMSLLLVFIWLLFGVVVVVLVVVEAT
jgi:hypothetical protein